LVEVDPRELIDLRSAGGDAEAEIDRAQPCEAISSLTAGNHSEPDTNTLVTVGAGAGLTVPLMVKSNAALSASLLFDPGVSAVGGGPHRVAGVVAAGGRRRGPRVGVGRVEPARDFAEQKNSFCVRVEQVLTERTARGVKRPHADRASVGVDIAVAGIELAVEWLERKQPSAVGWRAASGCVATRLKGTARAGSALPSANMVHATASTFALLMARCRP
jgi:hypothetical protein